MSDAEWKKSLQERVTAADLEGCRSSALGTYESDARASELFSVITSATGDVRAALFDGLCRKPDAALDAVDTLARGLAAHGEHLPVKRRRETALHTWEWVLPECERVEGGRGPGWRRAAAFLVEGRVRQRAFDEAADLARALVDVTPPGNKREALLPRLHLGTALSLAGHRDEADAVLTALAEEADVDVTMRRAALLELGLAALAAADFAAAKTRFAAYLDAEASEGDDDVHPLPLAGPPSDDAVETTLAHLRSSVRLNGLVNAATLSHLFVLEGRLLDAGRETDGAAVRDLATDWLARLIDDGEERSLEEVASLARQLGESVPRAALDVLEWTFAHWSGEPDTLEVIRDNLARARAAVA